jgi:excinuclease ABC subunit A
MTQGKWLRIRNASENNLQSVSLDLPKNRLIVVTGVSGSGKSSLVFDVIYREAESRYLGTFSANARQFLGRMRRPNVEQAEGLSPAIVVDQRSMISNPRSTVGTLSEIYDYLRLLFARIGRVEDMCLDLRIERSLFSFNSPLGACAVCRGLGVEDRLDPDLLIADENRSLRDGCLVLTAPNGYIIYSQVTLEVLDLVCRAEGFTIEIPWKDLTAAQKRIVLYGSDAIEIPCGKHPLESRMRWSGITVRPRERGHYRGILPVMEVILKRSRNKNILRFVRTSRCSACNGSRLNPNALSVRVHGHTIAGLASLQFNELQEMLQAIDFSPRESPIAAPILEVIVKRIGWLRRLGLAYLSPDRDSASLSAGESQRLRLAVQAGSGLSGVLYIFDEPSAGLHASDTHRLIEVLEMLRDKGNTVIVVEHEEEFIRRADWLVDIGPAAGADGGRVLVNIPTSDLENLPDTVIRQSRTLSFLKGLERIEMPAQRRGGNGLLSIRGATENNLKSVDVDFKLEALNVVTGVSGAGKSTLTDSVLGGFLRTRRNHSREKPGKCHSISGWEGISKVISIDASPIGKTPRSNPATYTGLFDCIRDLYAGLPASRARGWNKGTFSFNTAGGRCESCQGAGDRQIGMHFMGNVEVPCEECNGRRFNSDVLEIAIEGKTISDVLEMQVSEAREFFKGTARALRFLNTLDDLGLGYLKLGQRSSTLSGGEAQRIKLATELARPLSAHTLYIFDEPTTGLHHADVKNLLRALQALVEQGNTIILIEHHLGVIAAADWIVDLGPGSGNEGGALVAQGTPEDILGSAGSLTGEALREQLARPAGLPAQPAVLLPREEHAGENSIQFIGVSTNNLRHIDVAIPRNQITVITGVSGSGKSSLAFDTIFAEGQNRFLESFSTYARAQIGIHGKAQFERVSGLTPTLAVDQSALTANPRSTVGTATGIYDLYRLLYSRVAKADSGEPPGLSSLFSFNHQSGACRACSGIGYHTVCDPDMLITHPERSLLAGAMDGTKTGQFYGDPFGQYVATLRAVGEKHGCDFTAPWENLPEQGKYLALYGCGEEVYDVVWKYVRGKTRGEHRFRGGWSGLVNLVNAEYQRKHADQRGGSMLALMRRLLCPTCRGARLQPEALRFCIAGMNIFCLSQLTMSAALELFRGIDASIDEPSRRKIAAPLAAEIIKRLECLEELGLGYLTIHRTSSSLSGGEAQRVKLAAQLGSGLTGITCVLDEPTIGLHAADVGRLMKTLRRLQQADNTLVVVEHDPEIIRAADYVIDLGPGAGMQGGNIIAAGSPEEIQCNPDSITGRYLSGNLGAACAKERILRPGLEIRGACANNLRQLAVQVPAGGLIAVTGVSGSGKSSLVFDVILQTWEKGKACGCSSITGFEHFRRVVSVRQKPGFSSSLGTPITLTGVFERIRGLFSATEEARRLGLKKQHFSFIGKEGHCPACRGSGRITVSLDFLPDVHLVCEQCKGNRYREEVLACRYRDRNIAEVLAMTVGDAATFFSTERVVQVQLEMLKQVGLDYLQLGQPLDTLSGGESQRLALAAELEQGSRGDTLYLLDEPSTGLHFRDIEFLLNLFHRLADQGNTLLVIEHDPQIIRSADWIIDLGPEGGEKGGCLVAAGRLSDLLQKEDSLTGKYLRNKDHVS